MPVLVLSPFFADDIFHKGSKGLGFLMAAMGMGAVVGTLILARRTRAVHLAAAGIALGVLESLATVLAGGAWREVVASACVLVWLFLRGESVFADA